LVRQRDSMIDTRIGPYSARISAPRHWTCSCQKETFPKAEVHLLHGCGHWPFIDDQGRERALLAFLRTQWASR
jgi:pimeloyl-ACP methyl ester carboxylesterase